MWFAIFSALAQGITNTFATWRYMQESKQQAKEIAEQAQAQADDRAKKAKYQMQQQKTSFLKSGVYFDSGSPLELVNETYNTMRDDINDINKDSLTQQNRLKRAGQTAFFTYLIDPLGNNGGQTAGNLYSAFSSSNSKKSKADSSSTLLSGYPESSKATGVYTA